MSSQPGKVTLEVPAGTYKITASKDNLYGEVSGVTISSDNYQTTITIRPYPTLQVRVQDYKERAIAGASVKVIRASDNKEVASGTTGSDGTIKFQLEPGSYNVEASKSGYKRADPVNVNLTSDTSRSITLRGYSVIITVKDQQGNLVSGATVRILDQNNNEVDKGTTA